MSVELIELMKKNQITATPHCAQAAHSAKIARLPRAQGHFLFQIISLEERITRNENS
jgi:hypothetical protein